MNKMCCKLHVRNQSKYRLTWQCMTVTVEFCISSERSKTTVSNKSLGERTEQKEVDINKSP